MGSRGVLGRVVLPLLAVYALTATWDHPYHIDALTNAITGWYVGNEGTVIADQHDALATDEQYAQLGWFVDSPEGTVGQYPPGAAAVAGVASLLAPDDDMVTQTMVGNNFEDAGAVTIPVPPLWPATASAVAATALAAGLLALTVLELTRDHRIAIAAGLAFGLATGAWSVASSMSWTHGPAMLGLSLGLLAVARERWLLGGLGFGVAILCRPHLALVAATVGLAAGWQRRAWRPVVGIGVGSAIGLAAFLLYNWAVFHELTVSGGYGEGFEEQFAGSGLGWYAGNVLRGLLDPVHGLLPWAPFLLVLVPAVLAARRVIPLWCLAGVVGGALYLLVQWRANSFRGGEGFSGYRYPLEALTVAAPALVLGYVHGVRGRRLPERLVVATVAIGFAGQLTASLS